MTLINHRWRDRDIRSFDKHLKKYQGVNEILLAYDIVSEPMRVYFTDVGLFGGKSTSQLIIGHKTSSKSPKRDQACRCFQSRIEWNNIESVEFVEEEQELQIFWEKKFYKLALLRFKEKLNMMQNCWGGLSYIKGDPDTQNKALTLLLPEDLNEMKKAKIILKENIKEVI